MIHAPFNFVPLSDKVFFPDWADQISQDIPFTDGISGTIELKITAKTPIFVRNGHTKEDVESSFSHTSDGKYFIPATSIKGCIRNVMEIMSYGKMSFVANKSFGLRNLNNRPYRDSMRNVRCGWLQFKDGKYVLYNWGTPKRISIDAIAKKYGVEELGNFIRKNEAFAKTPPKDSLYYGKDCTSVKYKYDLLQQKGLDIANLREKVSFDRNNNGREIYQFGGDKVGYVVLTGQPGIRQYDDNQEKWTGKFYEFIFLEPASCACIDVPKEVMDAFMTVNDDSPAYTDVWKTYLNEGKRIPVFFKLDNNIPKSIGLTFMYKYPYSKSVHDAIPDEMLNSEQKEFKKDLPDCIFGYTFGGTSLKGRVQYGHAKANGTPQPLPSQTMVTLSPHASYYLLYVENGEDWNSAQRISGWKRYIVRNEACYRVNDQNGLQAKSKKVEKSACFLPTSTRFNEKIYFHNLRPVELGALLSAITFHGNQEKCFHNLGLGKAFGYGKIEIGEPIVSVMDNNGTMNLQNPYLYIAEFEKMMNQFSGETRWLDSIQIRELLGMANGINENDNHHNSFNYMTLEEYKNNRNCVFERFTELKGQTVQINDISAKSEELERKISEKKEQDEIRRRNEEFTPTSFKIGEKTKALCFADKKVHIGDNQYDISLVISKFRNVKSSDIIGKEVDVIIKQISKTGKIIQVEYVEN